MQSNIVTIFDLEQRSQVSETTFNTANPLEENQIVTQFVASAERNMRRDVIRLPSVENSLDRSWLNRFNQDQEYQDFRVGILANVVERRCDPGFFNFIIRYMTEEERNNLRQILSRPLNYENFETIISTMLIGIVGDMGIGEATQLIIRLSRETVEIPDFSIEINNMRNEMRETIQNNVDEARANIERISREGNDERRRIFNQINWNYILRRGLSLIGSGVGLYFATPYLRPLIETIGSTIGNSLLPERPSIDRSNTPIITPSIRENGTREWSEVSNAFTHAWNLFLDYWKK